MSTFKMPTGTKLDKILDKLTPEDAKAIRKQFELDVKKEDEKRDK